MTIWFTSDLHLGNRNIGFYAPARSKLWGTPEVQELATTYSKGKLSKEEFKKECERPSSFIDKSVTNMNEGLINNWNSRVLPGDDVYILGDFMMGQSVHWETMLRRLHGTLFLIKGNHDHKFVKQQFVKDRMEWIKDYHELRVPDKDSKHGKKQLIVMQHYAPYVFNGSHRGSWSLSGHSHGSLDKWHRDRLSLDVGVDSEHMNYFPISYEQVKKIMSTKKVKFVDHHDQDTNT